MKKQDTREPMKPEDFLQALAKVGMSKVYAAEQLGVTRQQIHNWATGKTKIPRAVQIVVASWLTRS